VIHPNGVYAYVLFEELNAIEVCSRDNTTGELIYINTT
jgi:hypothetical protein